MKTLQQLVGQLRATYGAIARKIEGLLELMNRSGESEDIRAAAEEIIRFLKVFKDSIDTLGRTLTRARKKENSQKMEEISESIQDLKALIGVAAKGGTKGKAYLKLISAINSANESIKNKLRQQEAQLTALAQRAAAV